MPANALQIPKRSLIVERRSEEILDVVLYESGAISSGSRDQMFLGFYGGVSN